MKFLIYDFDEEITQGLTISVKMKNPRAVGKEELRTTMKTKLRTLTLSAMRTSSYKTQ